MTGLYFYDNDVLDIAAGLAPVGRAASSRSPTSTAPISSEATCKVIRLGRGFAWLDTGTHDSLHDAASFVRTIEHRQGIKIMCLEEIALELGFVDAGQVRDGIARRLGEDRLCRAICATRAEARRRSLRRPWMSQRSANILVTGGAGFIG